MQLKIFFGRPFGFPLCPFCQRVFGIFQFTFPLSSWRIIRATMTDEELRNILVALVETMITVTRTAYLGHEMAWGCYQLLQEQSPDPLAVPARFREALHGAGKLTLERDEHVAQLEELLR